MYDEIFFKNKYNKFYKLKNGDIVIDCGANVGYYTCKAATEVGPNGLVIAIEPDKTLFEILLKNVSINNLDNVISTNKGIWDKKDRLVLYTSNKHPGDSSFILSKFNDTNRSYEVEVDSLDNILKILKIKKVDFLKMDIEGAETIAIRGANNLLKSNDKMKFVIAAYHKSTNNTFTSTEVLSILKSIGIKSMFLTPDNFIYKI
ncbi:MAG: FkbM family methyltransferase [Actinobacteria bacterium]|nr:FkbM family methyltransferase [Actinomycetota bacterium]